MITVTFNSESFECTTALKGTDYIHLLDADGCMTTAFDGISDFTGFTISGGSWTTPTATDSCYIATIGDDGVIHKSSKKCDDVGKIDTIKVNGTAQTITNKTVDITVPTALSSLTDDATHRVVTDTEKSAWNSKSTFSGNYNDLTNKPTIPTNNNQLTNGAGYTTNTGTVTSVAVKMNNAVKGTVTTSGTIDLGTVITSHQSLSSYATTSSVTTKLNRTDNVNSANTSYTTYMARGIALASSDTNPTANGCICFTYA